METTEFSVGSSPRLYSADPRTAECSSVKWSEVKWSEVEWSGVEWSGVEWSEVKWSEVKWSEVKWSEVKWSSWSVSERVQLSVVSWKSACKEKTRRLVWNDHQPRDPHSWGLIVSWALQGRLRRVGEIVELTFDKRSARAAVTREPECGKLKKLHC
jgi:hypothetical protein